MLSQVLVLKGYKSLKCSLVLYFNMVYGLWDMGSHLLRNVLEAMNSHITIDMSLTQFTLTNITKRRDRCRKESQSAG